MTLTWFVWSLNKNVSKGLSDFVDFRWGYFEKIGVNEDVTTFITRVFSDDPENLAFFKS